MSGLPEHDHLHDHHPAPADFGCTFALGINLNIGFVIPGKLNIVSTIWYQTQCAATGVG